MSNVEQWISDLALLPDIDMRNWQSFQHTHECRLLEQSELASQLQALGAVTGWIEETGAVHTLRQQNITLNGLPLSAEFYRDSSHWQLRQLPRGQWQLHHHQLTACQPASASHLGERVQQLLAAPGQGTLHYWRLWQADTENAPHCRIALLTELQEARP
jgi:hypothetical protein